MNKDERIKELEDAIRIANGDIDAYEGIGILYCMESCRSPESKEYKTIKEVLENAL